MQDPNPYASPRYAATDSTAEHIVRPLSVREIFADAWALLRTHWFVMLGAVFLVWGPSAVYMSYQDYFVLAEDDFRGSMRIARFFDAFIGIIATGAVIWAASAATNGEVPGLSNAMAQGFQAWPRIWWTRLLGTLGMILGLLLLILPGIYLAMRWSLAVPAAVAEGRSGADALNRSWTLTTGRTVHILAVAGVFIVGVVFISAPFVLMSVFLELDHWLLDVVQTMLIQVLAMYFTLCMYCIFRGSVREESPSH